MWEAGLLTCSVVWSVEPVCGPHEDHVGCTEEPSLVGMWVLGGSA